MATVFEKLNLKDEDPIVVVGAPASFERELAALDVRVLRRAPARSDVGFALVFATTAAQVADAAKTFAGGDHDIKLWLAYPKQSSRRYTCEFNRDTGWAALGDAGFEPVRQVAIDEDWSALRFRRTAFVKTLTRSRALSSEGKKRIKAR
jgi:hypothetical protein